MKRESELLSQLNDKEAEINKLKNKVDELQKSLDGCQAELNRIKQGVSTQIIRY